MEIKELREKLNTSSKIAKDECGDLNIFGKKGKIFIGEPYWFIFIRETRSWNNIKKKLNFMVVSQDGDYEGILKLDRYPTSVESTIIRKIVGLVKKKQLSLEHEKKLVESGIKFTSSYDTTT